MSDELKPCPFCGCHGVTMASDPSNPKRHAIKCEDCPGMADFHSSTAEQAIAAWNRRPTPEQSGEARDAGSVTLNREEVISLLNLIERHPAECAKFIRAAMDRSALGREG